MTGSELPDKVRAWLETQGYPLEMHVARAFQKGDFRVIQSDYCIDRETDEPREIDVLAFEQKMIGDVLLRLSFVVECKSSRDKPWVLFVSEQAGLSNPARVAQRAGNYLAQAFLSTVSKRKSVQSLPIFKVPARPAYGMTQAFTSGADICYAAAASVANASLSIATQHESSADTQSNLDVLDIVIPVIVTEARLFSAFLEDDSSISLNEEMFGLLLWRNPLVGMPHTIIHVVARPYLDNFVSEASASAKRLMELCKGELRKKLNEAHKRWKSQAL